MALQIIRLPRVTLSRGRTESPEIDYLVSSNDRSANLALQPICLGADGWWAASLCVLLLFDLPLSVPCVERCLCILVHFPLSVNSVCRSRFIGHRFSATTEKGQSPLPVYRITMLMLSVR